MTIHGVEHMFMVSKNNYSARAQCAGYLKKRFSEQLGLESLHADSERMERTIL